MSVALDRGDERPPENRSRVPTWLFRALVVLVFGALSAQLWRLQVVDYRLFADRSVANILRTAVIPPQRGVIYDRNRTILASNAPVFVVTITPADVPTDRMQEIEIRLANELRIAPQEIDKVIKTRQGRNDYSPFTAIVVRSNVDRDAVMRISEHSTEMPGVQVGVDSSRRYTDGNLISQIVGYMSAVPADDVDRLSALGYSPDDRIGAAGLEERYESDLRGAPGRRMYQVEATGKEVAEVRRDPAKPGNHLVTTIDLDLQRDVQRILEEGLRNDPKVGAAVVMDPRNGEILAMVSTPTFDNNVINDPSREDELNALLTDNEMQPMFPRAYAGQYAPGSVFKLVTGSGALQEGVATRDTMIESKGVMYVARDDNPSIKDAFMDNAAWGQQNFLQGLANSSNIYFFWLGGGYEENGRTIFQGLGVDRLAQYARAYGYGAQTGLDINGEKDGVVPSPAWKELRIGQPWYKGDTYNMSIGQGYVLVTPLQVASTTATIANGGTVWTPHLMKEEIDNDGNVVKSYQPKGRPLPIEPRHLALMREAMEGAFSGPHLKDFLIPGLRAAGKTGTAEYGNPDAKGNLQSHGWFTGFAPADDPVVAVAVFVEHGSGTTDASPIGARILRRYFGLPDMPANGTSASVSPQQPPQQATAQLPPASQPTPAGQPTPASQATP